MQAKLALEDGTVFTGTGFGAAGETCGEVVFNTSMTGYQEVLTDPSYTGQIVTMTYPLIGNYGTTSEDQESRASRWPGSSCANSLEEPSNFRSQSDLDSYLKAGSITGIEGIDTRAARAAPAGSGRDERRGLDHRSRRCVPREEGQGLPEHGRARPRQQGRAEVLRVGSPPRRLRRAHVRRPPEKRVVAIDYGMKWNILRA